MSKTVIDFIDEDGVVEYRYNLLESDDEVAFLENGLLIGEYEVQVDGECKIAVENSITTVLKNDSVKVEMLVGQPFMIAPVDVEIPSWDEAKGEFYEILSNRGIGDIGRTVRGFYLSQ